MNRRNIEPDDRGIDEAWLAFKKDDEMLSAPPSVRAAVMDVWHRERGQRNVPPVPGWRWHGQLMTAAAVSLIVGAAVIHLHRAPDVSSSISSPSPGLAAPTDPQRTESLQLVRVRMPREALETFGVALIEPQAATFVDVELVVADDGLTRSIRSVTAVVDGVPQE
jgi:hypothetical protein